MAVIDVTVAASGLTTTTTAYSAGDVLGGLMAFNIGVAAGLITDCILIDGSDVLGACDLFLFDSSVTIPADNTTPTTTPSDADALKSIGVIELPTPWDTGANRIASIDSLAKRVTALTGNTIYGMLITRTANAVFAGGATSVSVRLLGVSVS